MKNSRCMGGIIGLLMSLSLTAIVPSQLEAKTNNRSIRSVIDSFNKKMGITQRPLTDKEWEALKSAAKGMGAAGTIIAATVLAMKFMNRTPPVISPQPTFASLTPEAQWDVILKERKFDLITDDLRKQIPLKYTGTLLEKVIWIPDKTKRNEVLTDLLNANILQLIENRLITKQQELSYALANKDYNTVTDLVRRGADLPKDKFRWKGNILHEIITPQRDDRPFEGIVTVFENVLRVKKLYLNLNEEDKCGVSPIFAAMHQIQNFPMYYKEYLQIIDLLLQAGVDKNVIGLEYSNIHGAPKGSLLHAASHIDNKDICTDVIAHLLEKGVNPE